METQNNTLCEARWETAREVQCFLFCFCCFRIRSHPSRSASKGQNSALRRVSILTRLSPLFGSISAEDAQSSAFANRIDRRRFSLTRRDLFFSFDFFRKYNFHPRQVTCFAGCIAMEMRGVSGSIIVLEVLGTSSLMQLFFINILLAGSTPFPWYRSLVRTGNLATDRLICFSHRYAEELCCRPGCGF